MQTSHRVEAVGLAMLIGACLFFAAPIWLSNRCHFDWALIAVALGFFATLVVGFHPKVLTYVGAADLVMWLLSSAEQRTKQPLGAIARTYFRYLILLAAVYFTSMARQLIVMIFQGHEFSVSAMALPLYLIIVRKRLFGGGYEEYLGRYIFASLFLIMAGCFAMAFVPHLGWSELSCIIDRHQRIYSGMGTGTYLSPFCPLGITMPGMKGV